MNMGIVKKERGEAFKLFEQGLNVQEVHKQIPTVRIETVYRWYNLWRENPDKVVKRVQAEAVLSAFKTQTEAIVLDREDMDDLLQQAIEVRRAAFKHLLNLLDRDSDSVPWRAVSIASAVAVKHAEVEYKVGGYGYADVDKAVSTLFSLGYEVIDPSIDADSTVQKTE